MAKEQKPRTVSSGWRSSASQEILMERALMLKNIRAFFDGRDVIEVETPLLSQYCTTDPHLDSLQSRFRETPCYLNTSPEYAMKRLLADWGKPIYQICKAFRDDELGTFHNPEFTMLEWYRPGYDAEELMAELVELITVLSQSSKNAVLDKLHFESLSYQQAFEKFVGLDPHRATASECYQLAKDNDIEIPQGLRPTDNVNDWLDWFLTQQVLPGFNKTGFTFLYDYPAAQCALAKIAKNEQQVVAKRFELFFGELELANGFYELTDSEEQLQRFKLENKVRKQLGKSSARIDENFISALSAGLPECAGVAVGIDRLLMAFVQATHIEQVITFSWQKS